MTVRVPSLCLGWWQAAGRLLSAWIAFPEGGGCGSPHCVLLRTQGKGPGRCALRQKVWGAKKKNTKRTSPNHCHGTSEWAGGDNIWLRFSWVRESAPCKAPRLWPPARTVVSHPGGFQNTAVQVVCPWAAQTNLGRALVQRLEQWKGSAFPEVSAPT